LRDLRLDHAYAELSRSTRTGCTVTEVAMAAGFTHLSKFAAYYKARFGESPSDTARRGYVD
ncbi:MAG: helix-turn-helix domain-containing protein, partial [Sphingomonadales bacterium]